ncbi:MAG: hypothetical protein QM777_07070 [Pseudorhodoferax sp.]
MVDAEFAVQYLVLSQSARHPELMANVGNIALLQRAEACRPAAHRAWASRGRRLPRHCATCSTARAWTRRRRRSKPPTWPAERDAVLALWHAVFG